MTKTKHKILEILNSHSYYDTYISYVYHLQDPPRREILFNSNSITLTIIDAKDVSEIDNQEMRVDAWIILEYNEHGSLSYWKIPGIWGSYSSCEWFENKLHEVIIKQVTINKYEAI